MSRGCRGEIHDGIAMTLAALKPKMVAVLDALREARASGRWPFARMQPPLAGADVQTAMLAMEPALMPHGVGFGQAEGAIPPRQSARRRLLAVSANRVTILPLNHRALVWGEDSDVSPLDLGFRMRLRSERQCQRRPVRRPQPGLSACPMPMSSSRVKGTS
jgi:hypothetical protein